mmetsp:Transcript_1898/g.1696  ORF Transcript_1898/g.1696 Transcript_1898/m.1696 type:complete len:168 (+) Transcript_1898:338-841(+)
MVPRLQYKYMESKKLDNWKQEHGTILNKEAKKIMDKSDNQQPNHQANHQPTNQANLKINPSPRHKRSGSYNKKYSLINNIGFGERSRKSSQFMMNSGRSPSKGSNDFLPNIMNNTTDTSISTIQSFRYDRSSPMLNNSTVLSTKNITKEINLKRKRGNASHFDILKF